MQYFLIKFNEKDWSFNKTCETCYSVSRRGGGVIQTKAKQFERDLSAALAYYCKNRLNDERGLRVNTTLIHCGIHLFQKRLLQ